MASIGCGCDDMAVMPCLPHASHAVMTLVPPLPRRAWPWRLQESRRVVRVTMGGRVLEHMDVKGLRPEVRGRRDPGPDGCNVAVCGYKVVRTTFACLSASWKPEARARAGLTKSRKTLAALPHECWQPPCIHPAVLCGCMQGLVFTPDGCRMLVISEVSDRMIDGRGAGYAH